ncbi:hypothetical protein VPHD479_0259 [Vibrio phage D479]
MCYFFSIGTPHLIAPILHISKPGLPPIVPPANAVADVRERRTVSAIALIFILFPCGFVLSIA